MTVFGDCRLLKPKEVELIPFNFFLLVFFHIWYNVSSNDIPVPKNKVLAGLKGTELLVYVPHQNEYTVRIHFRVYYVHCVAKRRVSQFVLCI